MKAKSKIIIAVVSITLISVILLGCLNKGVAEVKPEQIQVKDFKWTEQEGSSSRYEIIVNSDYDGNIVIDEINIADKKVATYTNELRKGENIIRGSYPNYNPTTQKREELLIKVKSAYDQVPVTVSKVIDMPYLSVEITPSSTLIQREGDYLTLTNKGNTKGQFLVKNKNTIINLEDRGNPIKESCGVSPEITSIYPTIYSQNSIKIPLRIITNVGSCNLENGATGSDVIQVIFEYIQSNEVTGQVLERQDIVISEISLKYVNQ